MTPEVQTHIPPRISFLYPPVLRETLGSPSRPGALILGVRSIARVQRQLVRIGRENDLVALTPADCSVNPLRDFDRDCRAAMDWILEHLKTPLDALGQRLLLMAIVVGKMHGVGRIESFAAIIEALETLLELNRSVGRHHQAPELDAARQAFEGAASQKVIEDWEEYSARQFLEAGVRFIPPSRFLEAHHAVQAALSPLAEGNAAQLFVPGERPEFQFEELMDQSKIAVADSSITAAVADVLEESFTRCYSTRHERLFFDGQTTRRIDQERPVFLFRTW